MTAVELRQTLEREFEVCLTPQEIRNLTFARLEEIATKKQQTEMEDAPLEGTQAVFYGTKLFGDMGPVREEKCTMYTQLFFCNLATALSVLVHFP
jgi:hypothetical protein